MKKRILPIVIALLGMSAAASAQTYEMNVYTNQGVTTYTASGVTRVDFTQAAATTDTIPDGTDLATYINNNEVFDSLTNVTFPLHKKGSYTQSAPIVIPTGVKVKIVGDSTNIVLGANAGFVVSNGFSISGVNVNASASANPFISLSATPDASMLNALGGAGGYYIVSAPIQILNSTITGVNAQLIYDNNTKYCVASALISNCVIKLTSTTASGISANAVIYFKSGFIKDLTIQNSTVYQASTESNAKYFIQYNNSGRIDRAGYDKNTVCESINFNNNTFYNVAKTGQWCNYSGFVGQKYTAFNVKSNIWVDCSNGQVARYILGGRGATTYPNYNFGLNTYWFNGAAETGNATYDNTSTQLATDPVFKDVTNGDFTISGADQITNKTGDPRWIPATTE